MPMCRLCNYTCTGFLYIDTCSTRLQSLQKALEYMHRALDYHFLRDILRICYGNGVLFGQNLAGRPYLPPSSASADSKLQAKEREMLCRAHEPHPLGCKGHRQWKSQSHPWPLLRHQGCKAYYG